MGDTKQRTDDTFGFGPNDSIILVRDHISNDFEKLKHYWSAEERVIIEQRLYQSIRHLEDPRLQGDIYKSSGTEGGTSKHGTVRRKKLSGSLEESRHLAAECVRINTLVEEFIPNSTVFCYALHEMLLSENFYGEKLIKRRKHSSVEKFAPLDIILKQVSLANKLSIGLHPEDVDYSKHAYDIKMMEIWNILNSRYEISGMSSHFVGLASQLMALADTPNFDRHLENGKYDFSGTVKQMPDWTKVHFLVAPAYDAAQIIGQCNDRDITSKIRQQTQSELGLANIGIILEKNITYYNLRQLMFAIIKKDDFYIKKFESAIQNTVYSEWKDGEKFKLLIHPR